MEFKNVIHLVLILGLLILAGAAAGQAAAPINIAEEGFNDNYLHYEDYYQLRYSLKVIEINKEGQQQFDIDQFLLNSEGAEKFNFYRCQEMLEIVDIAGINRVVVAYDREEAINYRVAEPEIVVTMAETATLEIGEEQMLLPAAGDPVTGKTGLYISLFPRQISRDGGKVVTEVVIRSENQAYFVTSLRMNIGDEILAGLLTMETDNDTGSRKKQDKKVFAIYITVNEIGVLDSSGEKSAPEVLKLSGLDSLFLSADRFDESVSNTHLLLQGGKNLELSGYIDFKEGGFAIKLDQQQELIRIEIDKNMFSQLQLAAAVSHRKNSELQLALGVREEIKIEPGLILAAGVYPLVYSPATGEKQSGYWWFRAETASFRGWFLSIYHDGEAEKNALQLGIGKELGERCDLMLFYHMVPYGVDIVQAGLRLRF